MARATRQRRRIPHCRLMLAGHVKSGAVIYHKSMWRTIHRVFHDGFDVLFYFSSGVGSMNKIIGRYHIRHRVAVRLTIREARLKKQVA